MRSGHGATRLVARAVVATRAAMATSSSALEIHPSGVEVDLQCLYEARDALEMLLEGLDRDRGAAEAERVSALARDIAGGERDADAVADRARAIDADERQERERIETVQGALERIRCRIDALKRRHSDQAVQWLRRRIASLLREESTQQRQTRATAARVKVLQDELEALRGAPQRQDGRARGRRPRDARTKAPRGGRTGSDES